MEPKQEVFKNWVYNIAIKEGLIDTFIFVEWFTARFSYEDTHTDYIKEWAWRFKAGSPTLHMDPISLMMYTKTIHNNYSVFIQEQHETLKKIEGLRLIEKKSKSEENKNERTENK